MTEQDLVNQIKEYLNYKGYFVWRNNTGAFKNAKGGFFKFGMVGSSDILGVAPGGRFIAIECKKKGNKLSDHQGDFITRIIKMGGIAIVAFSLEDVINNLERINYV